MKLRLVALLSVVILPAAWVGAEVPAALNYASAEAAVVIVAPSLSEANARLGAFFAAMGVEDPQAADPVNTMLAQIGAVAGIDVNGSAVLVLPELQFMGEPAIYVVLSIADKEAFLGGFASAAPDAAVADMHVVAGPMGLPGYVRFFDKYAVLGNNAMVIAGHPGAGDGSAIMKSVGEVGASAIDGTDVYVYLNLAKVGPMLQPFVAMGLAQMQMQVQTDPAMAAQMGGNAEVAQAVLTMYGQLANVLLTESQAMVIGAEFPEAGPSLHYAMQFKPETATAKMFAKTPSAALTLNRLPDRPYLMAAVMDMTAVDWQPLVDAMNNTVLPQMPAGTAKTFLEIYAKSFEAISLFNEIELAWYMPELSSPEPSAMNLYYVYGSDDPAAALAKYREIVVQMVATMDAMVAQQAPEQPAMKMSYTADVEQLNGKGVDEFTMDMSAVPGAASNPMMPGGKMAMRISTTDNAMIVGTSVAALAEMAETAGGTSTMGGEMLAAAQQALPAGRFFEVYMNPGALFAMVSMMGMGGAVEDQPLPPLAMSGSSGGGGVSFSVHAPMATILGVKQTIEAMQAAPMEGEEEGWEDEEWIEEEESTGDEWSTEEEPAVEEPATEGVEIEEPAETQEVAPAE